MGKIGQHDCLCPAMNEGSGSKGRQYPLSGTGRGAFNWALTEVSVGMRGQAGEVATGNTYMIIHNKLIDSVIIHFIVCTICCDHIYSIIC